MIDRERLAWNLRSLEVELNSELMLITRPKTEHAHCPRLPRSGYDLQRMKEIESLIAAAKLIGEYIEHS